MTIVVVDEGHRVTLVYARIGVELDAFLGVSCGRLSRTMCMRDLVEKAQRGVSEVGRMNAMSFARKTGEYISDDACKLKHDTHQVNISAGTKILGSSFFQPWNVRDQREDRVKRVASGDEVIAAGTMEERVVACLLPFSVSACS